MKNLIQKIFLVLLFNSYLTINVYADLEELQELSQAIHTGNLEGTLDALVDTVYIALGTAYLMGFDFDKAWKRVHKANMQKIRCATKRSPIDVVKPIGWKPPKLDDLCK